MDIAKIVGLSKQGRVDARFLENFALFGLIWTQIGMGQLALIMIWLLKPKDGL